MIILDPPPGIWARYRRQRRLGVGATLGFVVLVATTLAAGHAAASWLAWLAGAGALLCLGIAMQAASSEAGLQCPRCRRAFFRRRAWLQPSFPRARCAHCGLRVGEAP
jgi:hypothetical protein